jgi:hypothetical protein
MMLKNLLLTVIVVLFISTSLSAETFNFMKLSDEVSYYANTDDDFNSMGRTLQIVAINQVKIGTWFQIEFTGDFNWELVEIPDVTYDYYIEFGVVKKIWKYFSVNYQRIYGTFVDRPVNQFGIRFTL